MRAKGNNNNKKQLVTIKVLPQDKIPTYLIRVAVSDGKRGGRGPYASAKQGQWQRIGLLGAINTQSWWWDKALLVAADTRSQCWVAWLPLGVEGGWMMDDG